MTTISTHECYTFNNLDEYGEEDQHVPYIYSLAKKVGDEIQVLHPPVKCRDFMHDAAYCSFTGKDAGVYGFKWKHEWTSIEEVTLVVFPKSKKALGGIKQYRDNIQWVFDQLNPEGWNTPEITILPVKDDLVDALYSSNEFSITPNEAICVSLDDKYLESFHLFSLVTWLTRAAWYKEDQPTLDVFVCSNNMIANDAKWAKAISSWHATPISFIMEHKDEIFIRREDYRNLKGSYDIHDEFGFVTLNNLMDNIKSIGESFKPDDYTQTAYNLYTALNNYGAEKKEVA